jgi:hypothetical protein
MIRKLADGRYRLYSRKKNPKTGRRRNLGTFTTRAAAQKHERAVQFFKRGGCHHLLQSSHPLSAAADRPLRGRAVCVADKQPRNHPARAGTAAAGLEPGGARRAAADDPHDRRPSP